MTNLFRLHVFSLILMTGFSGCRPVSSPQEELYGKSGGRSATAGCGKKRITGGVQKKIPPSKPEVHQTTWTNWARKVTWELAKKTGANGVEFSTPGKHFSIELKVKDLNELHCNNEVCTGYFSGRANADIPNLGVWEVSFREKGNSANSPGYEVELNGQTSKLQLGEIFEVKLLVGATIKSGETKTIDCKVTTICELPFATIRAVGNKEGIKFAVNLKLKSMTSDLVKVQGGPKTWEGEWKVESMRPWWEAIKRPFENISSGRKDLDREDLDIFFDAVSG